ncbi:hypothetical protein SESBI_45349 [Sesbania bispinosa]|nr:hypothetical protein SESBI_45349 [Sesbania bispinosa]
MAGGGNFMHRIISYVVNEVVVNGLANRARKQRQRAIAQRRRGKELEINRAEAAANKSKNGVREGSVGCDFKGDEIPMQTSVCVE